MSPATSTVVTRWWLVRHAPITAPPGLITGQLDLDADVAGVGAAGGLPPGAVWLATHLRRTRQTAAALGAPTPRIEPDLAEQSFGDWQGLTYDAVDADASRRFWSAPASERPPGGESFADVVVRVSAALERLTAAHAGRDVVAVVHAGTVRAALALALGLEPEAALRLQVDTLSLTRLDHIATPGHPPAWRVAGVNHPWPRSLSRCAICDGA
ncbi:histidine phosphatase family protein [Azospirillum sp.]|uniref:histidine phosphatase family protein n=1 Tax=Azospirillum sp. TaxID=34012 RepID=UPI003D73A617